MYDDLEENGRTVNNGDIVDSLWGKIQALELQQYLNSLKVDYQRKNCSYKEILQDLAGEVSTAVPTNFGGN